MENQNNLKGSRRYRRRKRLFSLRIGKYRFFIEKHEWVNVFRIFDHNTKGMKSAAEKAAKNLAKGFAAGGASVKNLEKNK